MSTLNHGIEQAADAYMAAWTEQNKLKYPDKRKRNRMAGRERQKCILRLRKLAIQAPGTAVAFPSTPSSALRCQFDAL